jgi:hypothetical protein
MIKDFGAQLKVVSPGGARGVAAGTGDNTKANGAIVDQLAHEDLISGCIVICGSATLQATETISVNEVFIEHGDLANLSDAAEYTFGSADTDYADVATGDTGGSTETFEVKQDVDLTGIKRYWRVTCKPDCSASGTDTFQLGMAFVGVGRKSPLV